MTEASIGKKDQKQWIRLQAKRRKQENIREEIRRIRAKDISQGGLSEGQERQIERNEQALKQLAEQVEQIEDELRDRYDGTPQKEACG